MPKEEVKHKGSKMHRQGMGIFRVVEHTSSSPRRQDSVRGVIETQQDGGDWSASQDNADTVSQATLVEAVDTPQPTETSSKPIANAGHLRRTMEGDPSEEFIKLQSSKIVRLENKLSRLAADYEDLRLMYDGLSTEHARLETQCEEMAIERDICEAKYNELLSERFNRQAAGLWVSPAKVKSAFSDLCHHVAAWCDDAVYQTARYRSKNSSGDGLTKLSDIHGGLLPISMSSSSLAAFIMANLFQSIVHLVFPSGEEIYQNNADLWARSTDIDWLTDLPERLQDQGISSDDIRLWLCLTTTALAPNRAHNTRRTKVVVDALWENVMPLLTLDSDEDRSQLKEKLEIDIMPRAVEISRLMRKCQQIILITWPDNQGGFISEVCDDGVERKHILTAPCLVSRVMKAGETKETILVDCRRHTIVDVGKTSGFVLQESAR